MSFSDYLNSINITNKLVEEFNHKFAIYVTNELDMAKAKRELLAYANSPFDSKYQKASWDNGKRFSTKRAFGNNVLMSYNVKTVTSIIEIICVVLFVISLFDKTFVVTTFALTPLMRFDSIFDYYRIITPIFVHFSLLHIAFNLVMFEAIARPIEKYLGYKKLFSLCLAIAVISNLLQYFLMQSYGYFGGLSGVVYGVIGYACVLSSRLNLSLAFNTPKGLLTVSIIFILLGFFMSGIANLCHLGGLIVGVLYALYDTRKQRKA